LTLAIDLARRGIGCRLIDRAMAPCEGSRGKGIQPRTLEIFEDLGVIEPIVAAGADYPKLRIHLGPFSMRVGSLGTSKAPSESVPYPNLRMVPQARTEEILRERLRGLGVEVEFNVALAALRQDKDGVEASFSTGETVRAQFLVGSDGGASTVRKRLGLKLEGDALDQEPMLVADVEMAGLDRTDWHIWPLARGGAMGLCPLPHTRLFQLTAKEAAMGGDLEGAVERATGYSVERVRWRSAYYPAVRMVNRYRVGRVFLAGDAAHVHPPAGGQGLNTGVQDAYNLGWKMAAAIGGGQDALLDSYQAERLPIAASVLGLSRRLSQAPTVKRGDTTNQLGLHYRSSSLSSGDALGGLHPGDRMPDVRLEDGSRLFEQMRGPQALEVATTAGAWILIRPDGYIARIGRNRCAEYGGAPVRLMRGAISLAGRP
jgi:2-polyprenyl-6-methoxyphenol hydroxylase-like FAD-dependent oxidoreductase